MKYKMVFYNFFHKKSIFNYSQKHKERLQREASEKKTKSFWRRKRQKAKNVPRKISKSSWGTKAETTWLYEKLLFNT